MVSPLIVFLYSYAALMPRPYGIPIDEPLPLSDVTKPMTISARAAGAAKTPATSASKLRILRIAFSSVGQGMNAWKLPERGFRWRTNRSKADVRRRIWARWQRICWAGRPQPWQRWSLDRWALGRIPRAVPCRDKRSLARSRCAADD